MRLLAVVAALLLQETGTQRIPEPTAEAQKAGLKEIKDLFKDEYGKKAPADQVDLARKLIKTSADATVEMTTKYVCLTEARDLAVAASETGVAMEAVTLLGKSFMIAVPAAKMTVLGKLAKDAKDVEKLRGLSRGYYELAKDGITSEDYETSTSAVAKADTLARAIKDASLTERIAELKKDLASLKSEQQKAKDSTDLDAVGRYTCFVRNDWPAGLKLLSEGGKSPLKELATKDLGNPEAAEVQVEVGDGWWQLAQAEKTTWKKLNILGRARYWYDLAQPNVTGLVKVKLGKRLVELDNQVPGSGINLMALIDPKRDAVHGTWTIEDGMLLDKGNESLSLQIPYEPPDEYDLRVSVKRMGGTDSAAIGLAIGSGQVTLLIDGYPDNGVFLAGFETIDGKYLNAQPGALKTKQMIVGDKPTVIDAAVRKTSITVMVDGKKLLSYEGPFSKLSGRADSKTPNEKTLYVGGWNGKMAFTEIRVTPLSGPGKKTK